MINAIGKVLTVIDVLIVLPSFVVLFTPNVDDKVPIVNTCVVCVDVDAVLVNVYVAVHDIVPVPVTVVNIPGVLSLVILNDHGSFGIAVTVPVKVAK